MTTSQTETVKEHLAALAERAERMDAARQRNNAAVARGNAKRRPASERQPGYVPTPGWS